MRNQSYTAGNKYLAEESLLDIGNRLDNNLERWKDVIKVGRDRLLGYFEAGMKPKVLRFWIVALLMAFGTLTYYGGYTPLVNISPLRELYNAPYDLFRAIFLIPIIYAAIVFRVRGSLIASLVFLCVVLPRAFIDSPYSFAILRAIVFVIITAFISLLVAIGSNRIDKEKENTKLLQYLASNIDKQEGEKQHLAREIHDGSLQVLLDISHSIDALSDVEDRRDVKLRLKHLRAKADDVQDSLRQLITGLRPPLLQELGLESSLRWLANEMAEERGIDVNVEIFGESRRLADTTELSLYRITQEALQNTKKYSRATEVGIRLGFIGNKVFLTIKDNGVGFSVPAQDKLAIKKKFGLVGMAERARLVGGNLRIESSEGNGTSILVEVPAKNIERSRVLFA